MDVPEKGKQNTFSCGLVAGVVEIRRNQDEEGGTEGDTTWRDS